MTNPLTAILLVLLSLAVAAMGFYTAQADDAPGAAMIGMLLMIAGVVLGLRVGRNRLVGMAAHAVLTVGIVVAAGAAYVTHQVVIHASLFSSAEAVPSVAAAAPNPAHAAAVERGRDLARAAVLDQNLPGLSIAVGIDDAVVWAEGFGWRDIDTRSPVTPATRFNIGTAAGTLAAGMEPLGLSGTGRDAAATWSPEHIGEPEEDFPGFAITRRVVFRPLGLAPAQPLPGDRATFYVPRTGTDPRTGRRLMYMRDLACCANGQTFSSTPSDVVRFAMASPVGAVHGELAGGMVMTLTRRGETGVSVAVMSNMAHADTVSLAQRIEDAFTR